MPEYVSHDTTWYRSRTSFRMYSLNRWGHWSIISLSLSVVSVLSHRYLLKHWPMKELGIALKRRKNFWCDKRKKSVVIPWLINDLSFKEISKAVRKKEPNLYSNINKWKGLNWGTDDLKKLRVKVSRHYIPTWRSYLKSLTRIVMVRSDQVKGED